MSLTELHSSWGSDQRAAVAQASNSRGFGRSPTDNEGIPEDMQSFFDGLFSELSDQFRYARIILASRSISLFRVDRPWTETHLLPLFNWKLNDAEALEVWEGFLWSPRVYPPLLNAIKNPFLETVEHYTELGENGRQFIALLTHVALDPPETYTTQDFRDAFAKLPQSGLEEAAQALVQALESAGDQREEYWDNRVLPFWQKIWPKNLERVSSTLAESLAWLCVVARGKFPVALSVIQYWLTPYEHPDFVVEMLNDSKLSARFPKDALQFLDAIVKAQPLAPAKLSECLDSIAQANHSLMDDPRYLRLRFYLRQRSN